MTPAYHTIAVGLVTGLFFFAVLAILARATLRFLGKDDHPIATYADRAAVGAVAIGLVLAVVGLVTGFLQWPLEATLRSALMKNKILAAFLMVAFWGMFLGVRWLRGPGLWKSKVMTVYATLLAVSGFVFGMITSSIGGDVAGNPTGFENIVRILGVETRYTFYLPTWLNVAIIAGGVILLVLAFAPRSRAVPATSETNEG